MSELAIILMFLGVSCMAMHAVGQRILLKHHSVRTILIVGLATSCLCYVSALLWWPWLVQALGWQTPLYRDPIMFWLAIAWTTGWNIFIQYATAKSRQGADLSLTQPFQALTPGLITLTAVLLHEYPTSIGITGIVLISGATYLHGREGARTVKEWLQPFRMIISLPSGFSQLSSADQRQALQNRSAVRWAVGSAFAGTMGLLGDGVAARHGNIVVGLTVLTGVLTLWYLLVPWLWSVRNGSKNAIALLPRIKRSDWSIVGLVGLTFALHHLLIFSAYRLAEIPYIGTMKRLSIIMTVILAAILLHERHNLKRRLLIGCIAVIGAILLSIDSGAQAQVLRSAEEYLMIIRQLID